MYITDANGHVLKYGISEFCHRSRKSNKVEKNCDLSQSVIMYILHMRYLMKVIPETIGAHQIGYLRFDYYH